MHASEIRRRGGGLVFGIGILVLGTLLLLHNLDFPIPHPARFWPLILIAVGLHKLWQGDFRSTSGWVILGIGVLFQLWFMDILPYHPIRLWPLALIGIGARILYQNARGGAPEAPPADATSGSVLNESVAFGGGERRIVTDDFKGGRLDVAFGGLEIDLSDSKIRESPAVLQVNIAFGGVDIRVPTGWAVTLKGGAVFGGCDDKTIHPAPDADAPRLVVAAYAMFGGCEVKN